MEQRGWELGLAGRSAEPAPRRLRLPGAPFAPRSSADCVLAAPPICLTHAEERLAAAFQNGPALLKTEDDRPLVARRTQTTDESAGVVLIADDDAVTRRLLDHHLQLAGFRTVLAADGEEAMRLMGRSVGVALIDLQMPKYSGLDCLRHAQEHFPDLQIIVISRFGEVRDAVEAMKKGAFEYITKPVDPDELLVHVRQALRSSQLASENRQLRQAVSSPMPPAPFVGKSPKALRLFEQLQRVAPLDATILLTGESGTGKTTLARLVHQLGPRAGGPFVLLSCPAFPRDLLEAEMFGHARGAFTGAISDRPGRAEMANGGTLCLDEIGDLPLELQPKLLNFLQDRTVQRIGGTEVRRIDVRIIAATNQDLERKCREGTFREDLFFRLNVLPIEVPPLRERAEDIPAFIDFILDRIARKRGCAVFQLDEEARQALGRYGWTGNVRELENVLERSTAFCTGARVTRADLTLPDRGGAGPPANGLAGLTLAEIERRALVETLAHCGGNKKAAAKLLDIDEKSIYNKMKRLGVQ